MHVLALQDYIRQSTNMWWDSRCIMNETAEWTRRLNKKTITSNRYCAWGWARQRPPKPAAVAWDWRSRKLPSAMGTVVVGLSYGWDILFGFQADRFHWGCTAASLSGGNEGKGKSKWGASARMKEPESILAMNIVHTGEGEINTSYQTVHDIIDNHTNLFLVASKEVWTARPQRMTAPSALWEIATLSIFRWWTTI